MQITERLWLLSQAVATVALPRLSNLSDCEASRCALTPLLTRLTLMITGAGAIGMGALAPVAVPLLFGEAFKDAAWPLILLLPGVTALAAARVIACDLAARGKPEKMIPVSLASLAVNILANLTLIPLLGLTGAALATSLA